MRFPALFALLFAPMLALAQATPPPHATNAQDALLITSVEQAYAAGLAAHEAGDHDKARQQFDRAVDLLLQSGADVKNNAPLAAELDRVVD